MNIRTLTSKDIERLEYICLATAAECFTKSDAAKQITLYKYNRYYSRQEKENCFVLCDNENCAVGYILCAENYDNYKKSFCNNELLKIGRYGFKNLVSAYFEMLSNRPFKKEYSAHLHIDILPEYQHKGFGTSLINTLCEHLKNKGVCGVMLGVGADNKNAISFYESNGFSILTKSPAALVMGKKL